MTEVEWLQCRDPDVLYLDRHAARPWPIRRLQLYACGCCRRIWDLMTDPRSRKGVELAEADADDAVIEEEFNAAFDAAERANDEIDGQTPTTTEHLARFEAITTMRAPSDVHWPVARVLAWHAPEDAFQTEFEDQYAGLADLFRDVFGNPFHPISIDPAWRTPEVVELARDCYRSRDFSRMPELADRLQRAGCRDAAVLDHCREVRIHIRGCWVVDLLLKMKERADPWGFKSA